MTHRATRRQRLSCSIAGVALLGTLVAGLWPQGTVASPQNAAASDGQALYRAYCASCHGLAGRGDGPVAPALRTPPADLTRLAQRNGGTYPAEQVAERIDGRMHVAAHGPAEMPVWGDPLSSSSLAGRGEQELATRVSALVDYLRTLQARRAD